VSDTKKYLRTEDGERVDQPDFQHAAERSQLNGLTQMGDSVLVGVDRARAAAGDPAQLRHYVLEGFEVRAQASGSIVEVDGGVALMGYRHERQVQYGAVNSGQTMQLHDVGGAANPGVVHTIWVRFNLADEDPGHRAFWNSAGAPPVEIVRSIPTRLAEEWQITHTEGDWQVAGTVSPGDEWMPVATVTPSDITNTLTGTRVFYFEGRESALFELGDADWGHATDRDPLRETNGVFGFRRFAMGVLRQLQGIIHGSGSVSLGSQPWYTDVTGFTSAGDEQGLRELHFNKLDSRGRTAGSPYGEMTGHLDPALANDNTLDIGSLTQRWRDFIGRGVQLGAGFIASQADALLPRITMPVRTTALDRTLLWEVTDSSYAPGTFRLYASKPAGTGLAYVATLNAAWNPATSQWDRDVVLVARDAVIVSVTPESATLTIGRHAAALAASWNDVFAAGGSDWAIVFRGPNNGTNRSELDSFDLTNNAGATVGGSESVYANSICKAWGMVQTDGAGLISTRRGYGYDQAGLVLTGPGGLQVDLLGTPNSTFDYAVVTSVVNAATGTPAAIGALPDALQPERFVINSTLNFNTVSVKIFFQVFGRTS